MIQTLKKNALGLLLLLMVFCIITAGLVNMNHSTKRNAQSSLQKAMQRSIMECYAMEGEYPKSLSYLEKNYHIAYDHNSYKVIYQYKGEQNLPSFKIVRQ